MKALYSALILSLCAPLFSSAVEKGDHPTKSAKTAVARITLRFDNKVGDRSLRLNDSAQVYRNADGDDFVVSTFKYYISNIGLVKTSGEVVPLPESYLLVNAADSTTLTQQLDGIPAGKYKGITFLIGVDSLRNFAGAQTGALDPAKGMFWSWKTGYIFVKMEGTSSRSTAKKNRLTFHIGGVLAPNNTLRAANLPFKKTLKVKAGARPEIDVTADVLTLFTGKNPVNFSSLNFTMGGPNSVVVADNYVNNLFRVTSVRK